LLQIIFQFLICLLRVSNPRVHLQVNRPYVQVWYNLFTCKQITSYLELEGGSKKDWLEEGDRGGHGPKMNRSATEDVLKQHYQLVLVLKNLCFLGWGGGNIFNITKISFGLQRLHITVQAYTDMPLVRHNSKFCRAFSSPYSGPNECPTSGAKAVAA